MFYNLRLTSVLSGRSLMKAFRTSTSNALPSPLFINSTISSLDLTKTTHFQSILQLTKAYSVSSNSLPLLWKKERTFETNCRRQNSQFKPEFPKRWQFSWALARLPSSRQFLRALMLFVHVASNFHVRLRVSILSRLSLRPRRTACHLR